MSPARSVPSALRLPPFALRPRPHPDLLVALAAVAGVAALHAAAAALDPLAVALPDAAAHEGDRVEVQARVLQARHGERGSFLLLAGDGQRLPALGGPRVGGAPGDLVRATGLVTRLDAGIGLSLERLDVLDPAATRALSPGDLARAPLDHEGARVAVRGEARDGYLHGDGARVRTVGEPPPRQGERLVAVGTFAYDEGRAAYLLRVESWSSS